MDIEETIEMKIMKEKEVGVGLEKGHTQVIVEGMTEATATVGQGQYQKQVLIETGLGVISAESMITLQKIVQQPKKKERQIKYNKSSI